MNFKLFITESVYELENSYKNLYKVEVNTSQEICGKLALRGARGFIDQNKNVFLWREYDADHEDTLFRINQERKKDKQPELTMQVPFYVNFTNVRIDGESQKRLYITTSEWHSSITTSNISPENFEFHLKQCPKFMRMIGYNLGYDPFHPNRQENIKINSPISSVA